MMAAMAAPGRVILVVLLAVLALQKADGQPVQSFVKRSGSRLVLDGQVSHCVSVSEHSSPSSLSLSLCIHHATERRPKLQRSLLGGFAGHLRRRACKASLTILWLRSFSDRQCPPALQIRWHEHVLAGP